MSSYIEQSLSKNEYLKSTFKLHWAYWLYFVFWFLLGFLLIIPFLFALLVLFYIISTEMGVTNRRVILKTGFISRKTQEMKLIAVETVEISQGILGRIFNMGTVKVTGRGTSTVKLKGVADPMAVKRRIEDSIEGEE